MLFIFSSAGQGGGSGGSIRDAGGSFGKMEQAQEEQFFRKLQQDQLKKMKTDTENETTKDATDEDKEKKKTSKWALKRRFLLFTYWMNLYFSQQIKYSK